MAIRPPSRKPTPGIAAPIDSSTLITRACMPCAVSSCTALIAATHCTPLPAPPRTEAAQAAARVGRRGQPEVADADDEGAEEEQDRQSGARRTAAKTMLPSTIPPPQLASSRP